MEATFIIAREDLQVDPVTIVAEGLLIGRLPICELLLNHPSVSRLHAGITYADGNYYLRTLRAKHRFCAGLVGSQSVIADCRLTCRRVGSTRGVRPLGLADNRATGNTKRGDAGRDARRGSSEKTAG